MEHDFVIKREEQEPVQYFVPSGFGHPKLPLITAEGKFLRYKWGLIPRWTKDLADAKKRSIQCLNCIGEEMADKPSFRSPLKEGKFCIVPVSGFFEWHHSASGEKYPFYIYPKNQPYFQISFRFIKFFAKLYDNLISNKIIAFKPLVNRL